MTRDDLIDAVKNCALSASSAGVFPYCEAWEVKSTLRTGAFALFEDFGPIIEGNTVPVLSKVVFIQASQAHSLHEALIFPSGRVGLTEPMDVIIPYPTSLEAYERRLRESLPGRNVRISHISPFKCDFAFL